MWYKTQVKNGSLNVRDDWEGNRVGYVPNGTIMTCQYSSPDAAWVHTYGGTAAGFVNTAYLNKLSVGFYWQYYLGISNLYNGCAKSLYVENLQNLLDENGYPCDADGVFGANTEAAVRKFQKDMGLGVDGIAGEKTKTALIGGTSV